MDALPFTYADIAIALVLLVSGVLAFVRGFVRELLHILAWVGAAAVAIYGFPFLQPVLLRYLQPELLANLATGAGLFVVSLVIFIFIAAGLAKRVQESDIGAVDRSLGFIFGLVRGALILALAYLVLAQLLPTERKEQPRWVTASRGLPFVAVGAEYLTKLAPELFESTLKTIDEAGDAAGDLIEDQGVKAIEDAADPDKESGREPGYSEAPRRQMDRLIESQQKR
jgi:membrane protein required for colicin V production